VGERLLRARAGPLRASGPGGGCGGALGHAVEPWSRWAELAWRPGRGRTCALELGRARGRGGGAHDGVGQLGWRCWATEAEQARGSVEGGPRALGGLARAGRKAELG
jgi:hypothetical protein